MTSQGVLKWLLRLIGGIELCAIPFLFFPMSWMNAIHDSVLGLGPLPQGVIVEYLARSLSAMYVLHGAVVFTVSMDVARYWPLIRILGTFHIAFGLAMIAIDAAAGLPGWWVAGEGTGIVVGGILVRWLTREPPAV
jgi:hypothetical protein